MREAGSFGQPGQGLRFLLQRLWHLGVHIVLVWLLVDNSLSIKQNDEVIK